MSYSAVLTMACVKFPAYFTGIPLLKDIYGGGRATLLILRKE